MIIYNRSTYDDLFIIKQLPEQLEGQFKCLGENTEEYITFSVPIKKEVANDDDSKKEENDDDDDDDDGDDDNENRKKIIMVKKRKQSHIDTKFC